jgi:hypothetical protein
MTSYGTGNRGADNTWSKPSLRMRKRNAVLWRDIESSDARIYAPRKSELRDLLAEAARNTAALPVEDER